MALTVRVTENRSFSKTIHLSGRLDDETAPMLDREVRKLAGAAGDVLVFNLQDLQYISSAGLRSIFNARAAMAERSGHVALVNAQPQVQKVFDIVRATDLTTVFTSVQELDRYLDAMQRKVVEGQ